MGIPLNELKKVTYANVDVLGDRSFLLMPLWDGKEWHQWVQLDRTTLAKLKVVDTMRANYVAKEAARPDDLFIPFVDFMWQRACWPEISHFINAICDDFHNLATSVAKIKHFHQASDVIRQDSLAPFVKTEMEYITVVARGIFDLLQEVIARLWNDRLLLLDPAAEILRKKHKLHEERFSKVVLTENKIRTFEEVIERYKLSLPIAEAYVAQAPFFQTLRLLRDGVIHGGKSIDTIYVTEKGFCVDTRDPAFAKLNIWKEEHYYNKNGIASLLPWLEHVIFGTINACADLMSAFSQVAEFPAEIAPGHKVFIRDHATSVLFDLGKVKKGEMVWWDKETKAA